MYDYLWFICALLKYLLGYDEPYEEPEAKELASTITYEQNAITYEHFPSLKEILKKYRSDLSGGTSNSTDSAFKLGDENE